MNSTNTLDQESDCSLPKNFCTLQKKLKLCFRVLLSILERILVLALLLEMLLVHELTAKTLYNFRTTKLFNSMDVPGWHTLVSLLELMVDSNYLLNTVFDWPHEQLGSCDFSLITSLHQRHLEYLSIWFSKFMALGLDDISPGFTSIQSLSLFPIDCKSACVVLNVSRVWKPRHNRLSEFKTSQ